MSLELERRNTAQQGAVTRLKINSETHQSRTPATSLTLFQVETQKVTDVMFCRFCVRQVTTKRRRRRATLRSCSAACCGVLAKSVRNTPEILYRFLVSGHTHFVPTGNCKWEFFAECSGPSILFATRGKGSKITTTGFCAIHESVKRICCQIRRRLWSVVG